MRVTVIGCSGSFPGPDSPASCYLLESDGVRIALDMGNGSLGALQAATDIYGIDAVVLSHLHVDHFIDLASYYVALKYRPGGFDGRRLPVWGPVATHQRLVAAYGLKGTDMSGELDIREIAEEFRIGPFRISTRRVPHPVEARAIRVEADGVSVTYSGDTGPHPELAEFADGSSLALFEASFLSRDDNPADLHLTAAEAAAASVQARADRLVLTHLVPWNPQADTLAEAQSVRADAQLAHPGLVIDL